MDRGRDDGDNGDNGDNGRTSCRVCGAAAREGFADCFCCRTLRVQLGSRLSPVAVALEYTVGDAIHRLLRGYKDGPSVAVRQLRTRALAARMDAWLRSLEGRRSLERFGPWQVVTAVPSSRRPAEPTADLIRLVPQLAGQFQRLLEPGPDTAGHLRAARDGFVVGVGVDRRRLGHQRVLVFDDSVTTGARAQSAAFALRAGGAEVVGIVAVGRAHRSPRRPERWPMA